jgi:CheY-like chemotaxis protein
VDLPLYTATEVLYPSITTAALILSLPEQFQREDGHIERSRTTINPPECEPIFSTNHVEVSVPENINPTAQIRVLIVDDSAMNRYIIQQCNYTLSRRKCSYLCHCRKMIRRMLENPMNAATMGIELLIEEADDGVTALQALKTAAETREDSYKIDNSSAHMHSGFSVTDNNFQGQIADSAVEDGELMKKRLCVGFNLIFIDYIMTTMNGPEAVQIMRKELKFTGGIIGVTGNALPADLTYFKECGADLVITKPLTNKRLMDAVHSVTQLQTGTPFHRR